MRSQIHKLLQPWVGRYIKNFLGPCLLLGMYPTLVVPSKQPDSELATVENFSVLPTAPASCIRMSNKSSSVVGND